MNKINGSQSHCSGLHPEEVSSVLPHFLITKHDSSPLYLPRKEPVNLGKKLEEEINSRNEDANV